MSLLSVNADAKTVKGQKEGYLTGIYLSPHTSGGLKSALGRPISLCPNATPGCIASCLYTAGRASFQPSVNLARARKTRELFTDRAGFIERLSKDIAALERKAGREGLKPAVRLNGTSDLAWENLAPALFRDYPFVQFYDYTKSPQRMRAFLQGRLPANYHLTFSLAETEDNRRDALEILSMGGVVAAVFGIKPTGPKPAHFMGWPVSDADETDLRFLDQPGTIAGLSAKGRAKQDRTGFVIRKGG